MDSPVISNSPSQTSDTEQFANGEVQLPSHHDIDTIPDEGLGMMDVEPNGSITQELGFKSPDAELIETHTREQMEHSEGSAVDADNQSSVQDQCASSVATSLTTQSRTTSSPCPSFRELQEPQMGSTTPVSPENETGTKAESSEDSKAPTLDKERQAAIEGEPTDNSGLPDVVDQEMPDSIFGNDGASQAPSRNKGGQAPTQGDKVGGNVNVVAGEESGSLTGIVQDFDSGPPDAEDQVMADEVSEHEDERAEEEGTKYDLRPIERELKVGAGLWIDRDETGNYDPVEEANKERDRKRNAERRAIERAELESERMHVGESTSEEELSDPPEESRLITTVRWTSEKGKAEFEALVNKFPTLVQPQEELTTGYRLRRRQSAPLLRTADHTGVRPPSPVNDLTGQPAARGCLCCASIPIHCSLLDNEFQWPCRACIEDDNDCVLVQPPPKMAACTSCQKAKGRKAGSCSILLEGGQDLPCERCAKHPNLHCVAGPDLQEVHQRIRIGEDGQPFVNQRPRPPKRLVLKPKAISRSCKQCVNAEKTCSFSGGEAVGPCTACDMAGQNCSPMEHVAPQHKRKDPRQVISDVSLTAEKDISKRSGGLDIWDPNYDSIPDAHKPATDHMPDTNKTATDPITDIDKPAADPITDIGKPDTDQPLDREADRDSPEVVVVGETIRTKMCHPIQFNYSDGPCTFCENAQIPILGMPERKVSVRRLPQGKGYEEIGGGYRYKGYPTTKICPECTAPYILVACCPEHMLRRIPGVQREKLDTQRALHMLTAGVATVSDRWCSVCVNLATHQCCTEQESVITGDEVDGCGLALCEACIDDMKNMRGSEGMLNPSAEALLERVVDKRTYERPNGIRADHTFLKKKGPPMKQILGEE